MDSSFRQHNLENVLRVKLLGATLVKGGPNASKTVKGQHILSFLFSTAHSDYLSP